ncbi:glycosyltransferase family 2 protein [Thermodesulfobacteriota bacterium]
MGNSILKRGENYIDCAILVLNYNGRDILSKCLPSIVDASKKTMKRCNTILVDNQSIDDSVDFVRRCFPSIEIVITPRNDYLFSLNDVVKQRKEDIVIILNNDMKVDENFIKPLLIHFSQPDVFAVTSSIHNWLEENSFNSTPASLCFFQTKNGWYEEVYYPSPEKPCFVQLASGGASAFRRKMFLALNGFDPLFRPGYSEDLDLSYRAWQHGWKTIYDPKSVVYHLGSISMKKKFGSKRYLIVLRNRILVFTKLFGNTKAFSRFILLYPKRMFQHFVIGDKMLAQAMLMALPRLPLAFFKRFKMKNSVPSYLSEKEIASYFMKTF